VKVKLAKTAGFCMGVRRAVELVLRTAAESHNPIFTWGPLIHNPQTVDFLKEQGVGVVESFDEIPENATIVIRSHGIPPEVREKLTELDVNICDATCPRVGNVQGIAKKFAVEGRDVIIVGYREHAEVKGLLGYAGEKGMVVVSLDEVDNLPQLDRPVVIGQTTLNRDCYFAIADAVKKRFPETEIIDTLCESTSQRQQEVVELTEESDAIIVVGGFNSSNTKRLYEIAKSTGIPSFWVETADELSPGDFAGMSSVAVTAGASTPHWIVSRVIERLERFGEKRLPPWEWPWIKDFGYAIIQSNILTGLAAAMLAATAIFLTGKPMPVNALIATGLFVFSMHTIYNLVDWQGLALVDPSKIRFFIGNRKLLSVASISGLIISLPLIWFSGVWPFILMVLGVIVSGVFAFSKKLPRFLTRYSFATWGEIPGAKDIFHTAGWFFAAGIIPVISVKAHFWPSILALGWVAMLSILRASLFSITDLETDRVLGRASFATTIGERGTWNISTAAVALSAAIICTGVSFDLLPNISFFEIVPLVYMFVLLFRLRRSGIRRGTWAELAVDVGYLLGGIVAILLRIST